MDSHKRCARVADDPVSRVSRARNAVVNFSTDRHYKSEPPYMEETTRREWGGTLPLSFVTTSRRNE